MLRQPAGELETSRAERHARKSATAATVRTQCFYPEIQHLTAWLRLRADIIAHDQSRALRWRYQDAPFGLGRHRTRCCERPQSRTSLRTLVVSACSSPGNALRLAEPRSLAMAAERLARWRMVV